MRPERSLAGGWGLLPVKSVKSPEHNQVHRAASSGRSSAAPRTRRNSVAVNLSDHHQLRERLAVPN